MQHDGININVNMPLIDNVQLPVLMLRKKQMPSTVNEASMLEAVSWAQVKTIFRMKKIASGFIAVQAKVFLR